MKELKRRLHLLFRLIDEAPIARTAFEETMRQQLLRCVARGKHGLTNK